MSSGYIYSAIAVMATATFLTRAAPFLGSCWLRRSGRADRRHSEWIDRLSRNLPPAILVVLVIYCLKDVRLTVPPYGLPPLLALATCIGLHVWKRNALLSIVSGTLCFVALVRWLG